MAQQTRERVLAGRYRVIERLGSGGMATVYLAEDLRLGRRVAVKVLHADSPEDAARRFAREARLLASLNHPNIVSVFDTVSDDEGVLIVMEYVAGESLAAALRRGPLEPQRAVEVVSAVAAALDHAHEHGVIHRDVKPANVLLGDPGPVKLADLGIARAAEGTTVTRTGTVLGTPSYMAPEQLEGRELTAAVDVYALAAVAWEALVGRKAYEGRTPMEIAHRVASQPPPDLRDAWPRAPVAAADVLRRAMARAPSDRPRSAGELARELNAALGDDDTAPTRRLAGAAPPVAAAAAGAAAPPRRAEPPAPPPRPGRGRGRIPAWLPVALIAVVVAIVAALAAAGGGDGDSGDREALAPPTGEQEERPPAEEEPAPPGEQQQAEAQPGDPVAEGLELQSSGYSAMQAGRYEEAIQDSRRAMELLEGSGRAEYWYAMYNLGRSLRLAGRPQEAIPVLEQRLQYADQRGTVERELELAREAAGQGGEAEGDGQGDGPGRGNGRGGGKKEKDD